MEDKHINCKFLCGRKNISFQLLYNWPCIPSRWWCFYVGTSRIIKEKKEYSFQSPYPRFPCRVLLIFLGPFPLGSHMMLRRRKSFAFIPLIPRVSCRVTSDFLKNTGYISRVQMDFNPPRMGILQVLYQLCNQKARQREKTWQHR